MKQLLVFLFLLCSANMFAQDVIVKKDGSTIVCRVVELNSSEIVYKKWSDLNGSNYVMNRTDASAINYENGKKVNLSEATNLYKPNNQNDGTQQYNDNALLKMDYVSSNPLKKVKYLKAIGWISGVLMCAGGITSIILGTNVNPKEANWFYIGGGLGIAAGVACTYGFLKIADKEKERIEKKMYSQTIYMHDFHFNNGSTISAGIDLLGNNNMEYNTIGLGLRYNF